MSSLLLILLSRPSPTVGTSIQKLHGIEISRAGLKLPKGNDIIPVEGQFSVLYSVTCEDEQVRTLHGGVVPLETDPE